MWGNILPKQIDVLRLHEPPKQLVQAPLVSLQFEAELLQSSCDVHGQSWVTSIVADIKLKFC